MNLAFTLSRSTFGIEAKTVSVEVHLSNGLPSFTIVGLAAMAVKESKDRVRSAIINSQFDFPCRRITVNLAPADLPKTSSGFDLPIAIGILAASGQIPLEKIKDYEFIGELALSGNLRPVSGIIPAILAAKKAHHPFIIPLENGVDASLIGYQSLFTAGSLREVVHFFIHDNPLQTAPEKQDIPLIHNTLDWSDIKGQQHAKQAMIIAAIGGHSILLSGPPGSGKTMLAKRFPSILPLLAEEKAIECAAIHSIRGNLLWGQNFYMPPFRAPHHTASHLALVGGGNPPKPGEISLAHHGVLFLDELPEFNKIVLETLREPLESGHICISRAAIQTEFPAQFQLIAAMNPCPCGHWGNPKSHCLCTPERITRYLAKISGPILDRIDMHVSVQALTEEELLKPNTTEPKESARIRERVARIKELQFARQGCTNAQLEARVCESVCQLKDEEQAFLAQVLQRLKLSARGYHRLLKVARTIADLQEQESVSLPTLQQALSYKQNLNPPV